MTTRITRIALAVGAGVLIAVGVGLGYWWGHSRSAPVATPSGAGAQRTVLYWYDPMVPDQHFPKAGKSPFMDMPLVPRYADEAAAGAIAVSSGVQQNLGIRTVIVKRGRLEGVVRAPGTITWDLQRERVVSARVDAIVQRLFVRNPYEPVRAGQPLASVLAPQWSTALAEARALRRAQGQEGRDLASAATERLRVLGLPATASSRDGTIVLTSPLSGVVSEIGAREGQSVSAGTVLFRLNGLETVWVEAALPQGSTGDIRAGTPVEARVSAQPGRAFKGRVEAVLPQVDAASRTMRARIVLDNRDQLLLPGMYAEVLLSPSEAEELPLVPTEAVIGSDGEARVIVRNRDGRFRPVAVQAGHSGGGFTEVLDGLRGGEEVVASGQFLIDSEASLTGALERFNARAGASSPTPAEGERKVLYWFDPMRPDKHFDRPGKSPYMDMPLVPKYEDEQSPEPQR